MRLKSLLIIGLIATLVVVAVLLTGQAWISDRHDQLMQERYAVDAFSHDIGRLKNLTADYLLDKKPRAETQWLHQHASLLASSLELKEVLGEDSYAEVKTNLDRLKSLFHLTTDAHAAQDPGERAREQELSLIGQLLISNERVASIVEGLARDYRDRFGQASGQLKWLLWLGLIFSVLLLTTFWSVLAIRVIQPVRGIEQRIHALADDPGFRLSSRRRDEIGDLARSFDGLADRLQSSTVSVEALETKVESRRQAEVALRRVKSNFERSQRLAHIGTWELDLATNVLWWSAEVYRIFEVDPTTPALSYQTYLERIHPQDRQRVDQVYRASIDDRRSYKTEYRLLFKEGRVRYMVEHGETTYDETGRPLCSIGTVQDVTQQKQAEQLTERYARQLEMSLSDLGQSEKRLSQLLETLPYGVQENDIHGRITFSNAAHHRILGVPVGGLIGHRIWDFLPTDKQKIAMQSYLGYLIREQPEPANFPIQNQTLDGREVDLEICWDYQRDEAGEVTGFISVISDITDRRAVESRLRLLASVFENTAEGVVVTDSEGNIIEVNQAFTDISGYSRDEVIGHNPRMWQSGRHAKDFYQTMWVSLKETGQWRGEIWNRRKNGEIFPEWQHLTAVRDELGRLTHYVSVFSDISQIKEAQQRLDHLAHHDPLTGLPNRLLLTERLEQAILNARRLNTRVAVVFIDLDHFKHVNDSLGHLFGDQLLRTVAERIQHSVRENDTVSRIGGDEFVLVLEGVESAQDLVVLTQKLMHVLSRPYTLDEHEVLVTPSMGVCLFPDDGEEPSVLFRNADAAMYLAKREGRNTYSFYTRELTRKTDERVTIENGLSKAIERGELKLLYQPQVDLHSGQLQGMEARIRWFSQEMGQVSPAKFIPIAEESSLIRGIGEWMLREACGQGRKWLDQGVGFGCIGVNVAGPQIQAGDLPDRVEEILDVTGLPAEYLELEISENFLLRDAEALAAQFSALRELGVSLAIDDYGTGQMSLACLRQLPLHKLKLDHSFVSDLNEKSTNRAIVETIIALGKSLGLTLAAEGVETRTQAEFLRSAGCDLAQGSLYARPVSAGEIPKLTVEIP